MSVIDIVRTMRPHQWVKNILCFVPLFSAGRWGSASSCLAAVVAFIAFSSMASAGYVLNDINDAADDRTHPTKRGRPIAAGRLSRQLAYVVASVLVAVGLGVSMLSGAELRWIVGGYLLATALYTSVLRKYFIADALALASLFTIRIVGGCAAIEVRPSIWLLSLSMFVFFSLGLTKRVRELQVIRDRSGATRSSRDYSVGDIDLLRAAGMSSATVSVLVVALYLESSRSALIYRESSWLWFTCPVIWYWLIRVWFKCDRGELNDDPILFALHDRGSWLCLLAIGACWVASVLGVPPIIGP